MSLVRRFLVVQALLFWQGGFVFYAAVVVPTGTEVLGSFEQGRVTRHVTHAMHVIGAASLVILAWDQLANGDRAGCRRLRWLLWCFLGGGLAALAILHPRIESYVDFTASGRVIDYPAFYQWHRVYLYVATGEWVAGLGYVAVMLRAWQVTPRPA